MATIIILMLVGGTGLAQEPAGRKLYPVDESHLDPSFAEFKANLLTAIETQDREFLHSALGPEVRVDFEGPIPADHAMETFDRDEGARWKVLHRLLLMGVKQFEDGRFYAPFASYVIAIDHGFDWRRHIVITDKDVEVYTEPKSEAPVIALLSYDIVEFDRRESSWDLSEGWFKVTTPDGQTGYVRAEDGYTSDSDSAEFAKHEGEWKLIAVIARD